jgi:hypothetical protein
VQEQRVYNELVSFPAKGSVDYAEEAFAPDQTEEGSWRL